MQQITLINGNCLEILISIPDQSINMIFADLPYNTTQNTWDKEIPLQDYIDISGTNISKEEWFLKAYKQGYSFEEVSIKWENGHHAGLWTHLNKIIKVNGVIALWAQSPFDKELAASNPLMYRYEWIIEKTKGTGHLNAKKIPMKCHENILIFYKSLPKYNPQMTDGHPPVHSFTKHIDNGSNYGKGKIGVSGGGQTTRYPRDILKFSWDTQKSKLHPTQKPLAACEYFIRTYTDENDTVLVFCMGSNTTGLAAKNLNRKYIGIELNTDYFEIARERIS